MNSEMTVKRAVLLIFCSLLCIVFLCSCSSEPGKSSGSPTVTANFSVGSRPFDTLRAAVEYLGTKAAPTSNTIKMNRNVRGDGADISGITDEIAIDFQSYIYTFTGNSAIRISGCTVEMKNINMPSGQFFIEGNSDVTVSGASSFTGTVSVSDSGFSINSSRSVEMNLASVNSDVYFGSDVTLNELDSDSLSVFHYSDGVSVELNNPSLADEMFDSALKTGTARYTGVIDYTSVPVNNTEYSYTYKAEFEFGADGTCTMNVSVKENSEWTLFGTLEGTYRCNLYPALTGRIIWNENSRALYSTLHFSLVSVSEGVYKLTLTDGDDGTLVFQEEST